MSLYGLDILVDQDEQFHLNEINGVCSGMDGFEEIYGDNRVKKQVLDSLREEYGHITVNEGEEARYIAQHPIRTILKGLLAKILRPRKHPTHLSKNAHVSWMYENVPNLRTIELPFPKYNGEESTVYNVANEPIPHPQINDYVAEEVTRDKFMQSRTLRDTDLNTIPSALVGLGSGNPRIELVNEWYVLKPVMGKCGSGVEFISREEARELLNDIGPAEDGGTLRYIEDFIYEGDFEFTQAISLLQPYINTHKNGVSRAIRAIVCNGRFVDAYMRISPDPKVNLSQGAIAKPFEHSYLPALCERAVETFESKCSELDPETFRKDIYTGYMEELGRTPALMSLFGLRHSIKGLAELIERA